MNGKKTFLVGAVIFIFFLSFKLFLWGERSIPFVAVSSGSMVHEEGDTRLLDWLSSRGFSDVEIEDFPFMKGINIGDMIVTWYPGGVRVGDVVTFDRGTKHGDFYQANDSLTHRVVGLVEVVNGKAVGKGGTLDCMTIEDAQMFADYVARCQLGEDPCLYEVLPETNDYYLYWTRGDHNDNADQCARAGGIAIPVNEAQLRAKAIFSIPYGGYPKLLINDALGFFSLAPFY
ncbi:MAG: hypothetical protein ABH950_04820 [Candidatus Altiarchaeota archaeon]